MIAQAIAYEDADSTLVQAFEVLPEEAKKGGYWSDPVVKELRIKIKGFYISAQNARCCYCNRHLGTENHRNWDVEHIVSRNKHPRFMFTPKNLAGSCPDCNISKAEQETLVNVNRKTYPASSEGFRIVHPHFDKFESHIRAYGMVYVPVTKKGKKTIYMCDLLRFAQKYIKWDNSAAETAFEADVDAVFEGGGAAEDALASILSELPIK